MITVKSPREIALMREAGRLTANARAAVAAAVRPGITTAELDRVAAEVIREGGGVPAFKNYPNPTGGPPFPGNICVSINEEVVHGVPGPRKLREGDIVSLDFGCSLNGYFGDCGVTVGVGQIRAEAQALLDVTKEALQRAIPLCIPGRRLTDISDAIQTFVEANGFSVVREYVGHGIGRKMHEDPQVPNYGPPGQGPLLKPGMVFAIEPMVNSGGHECRTLPDTWTVVTADGSLSAYFEETVAITPDGPDVLTVPG